MAVTFKKKVEEIVYGGWTITEISATDDRREWHGSATSKDGETLVYIDDASDLQHLLSKMRREINKQKNES